MPWIINDGLWEQVAEDTEGSITDAEYDSINGPVDSGSSGASGGATDNTTTPSPMDGILAWLKDPKNLGTNAVGGALLAAIIADRNREQKLKQTGSTTQSYSTDTTTAINKALKELGENNFTPTLGRTDDQTNALLGAKTTAENKFTAPLAAGLSNNQSSGITNARDSVGAWKPNLTAAEGQVNASATTIPQADLSAYMNPYIMASLQPQLQEHDRNLQQQLNQADAKALNSWGNRADLVRNDIMRGGDVTRSGIVGQGLNTGFNTATNLFQQDMERRLKAGGALAGLAKDTSALNAADTSGLMDTGAVATATYQNQLDKQYQEWVRQQNAAAGYGATALEMANKTAASDLEKQKFAAGLPATNAAAIAGLKVPTGTTTSMTTTGTPPSLAAQLAGTATTMFGVDKVVNPPAKVTP